MQKFVTLLLVAGVAAAMPEEKAAGAGQKQKFNLQEFFQKKFGASAPSGSRAHREEVSYSLVEKNDKFEERIYPNWNWACKNVDSAGTKADHALDFVSLAMYLQGENVAGERMALTTPVIMQRRPDGGAVMCAPLPASHQASLPEPLAESIRLVAVPQTSVFVRKFSGLAKGADWMSEAKELKGHLTEAGREFQRMIVSAVFSDPGQMENRRNEVWLIKA